MSRMRFRVRSACRGAMVFRFLALMAVAFSSVTAMAGEVVTLKPTAMRYGDSSRRGVPFAKDPTVIRQDGRYLMYYSIRSATPTAVPWMKARDPRQVWHSGIAESEDLVHWKRVADVDVRTLTGERLVGVVAPCVKKIEGKIHMFYQREWPKAGNNGVIWLATSEDGLHFSNVGDEPVFIPRNSWSVARAIDAEVFRVGDELVLLFATRDAPHAQIQMIGMATAPYGSSYDATCWKEITTSGPLLRPVKPWEQHCIEAPTVIRRKDTWYLFYAGAYNHERQMIGLMTSTNGKDFTRVGDGLVLPCGAAGTWNAAESGHPGVFEDDDGRVYLFFQGKDCRDGDYILSCAEVIFRE